MPLGASLDAILLRAVAACNEAECSGKWNQLAVLGLYCKLFKEKYKHDYDPKEHGWEWAQKQIAQLFKNAHSADFARWCVVALFHRQMNWFKTKDLDALAKPSRFAKVEAHAFSVRRDVEELLERYQRGDMSTKDEEALHKLHWYEIDSGYRHIQRQFADSTEALASKQPSK